MKVDKKKKPTKFLATNWDLSQKSGDLKEKKPSKSDKFGSFFPRKILCIG